MPIHDLYSKRQKRNGGEVSEVFQYENFPQPFRVQVMCILRDLSLDIRINRKEYFQKIHDSLCREYGLNNLLGRETPRLHESKIKDFISICKDIEVLDIIECSFKHYKNISEDELYYLEEELKGIDKPTEIKEMEKRVSSKRLHCAINEMNERFLEHGIGYQFESNEIIRIDSKLIHSEVVKPALRILTDDMYKGANDEFLKAHEHYRYGRYKECLNECFKSFESTMKAICKKRKWTYSETDNAKRLIEICFQNNLIPDYLQSKFTSLRSSLECGIPTVRNRTSGHGQGSEISEVPSYLASYLLHLTATTILLLADAEKALT
jgi:AbiJ N-terminal domain 4